MQVPVLSDDAKSRIQSILARASSDISFRSWLLKDPEAALAGTDLSDAEIDALSCMRRVALEEWGIDVRRFRSFLRDNGNKISPVQSK